MITLTHDEWGDISERISMEYPRSVLLVRAKMKEVMGFTTRTSDPQWKYGSPRYTYHLDFYDESKETFFRMKYL